MSEQPTETELRDAFKLLPMPGRFREPRELGKPPVDPDAEQLADQLARDVVLEQERVG